MEQRLAIVAIDAGSDIDGQHDLGGPKTGTSSGKGLVAEGLRGSGFLAYDSGRAYRTITLAAEMEGLEAGDDKFDLTLKRWIEAGRFGHCATGMTLDGIEVDEHILHGVDVSRRVATFSAREDVRELTKAMKVDWLRSYAIDQANGLVGLDGRGMREFVRYMAERQVSEAKLITSLCMVVDPVEAARRRMAQRGVIRYEDPKWMLHDDLQRTVNELEDRARLDEARTIDRVGLPGHFVAYTHSGGEFSLLSPSSEGFMDDRWIKSAGSILIDTTGAPKEDVTRLSKDLIARSLAAAEHDFNVDIDRLVA